MSYIIRVVGPAGYTRFLALRLVDRDGADKFLDADAAVAMADAVHGALDCFADVVNPDDAEEKPR